MTDWFKTNFNLGNIITISVLVAAIIASAVRAEYTDAYHDKVLADHEQRLRQHENNRDIHIDPNRDERFRQELMERLRRIEAKLDANR